MSLKFITLCRIVYISHYRLRLTIFSMKILPDSYTNYLPTIVLGFIRWLRSCTKKVDNKLSLYTILCFQRLCHQQRRRVHTYRTAGRPLASKSAGERMSSRTRATSSTFPLILSRITLRLLGDVLALLRHKEKRHKLLDSVVRNHSTCSFVVFLCHNAFAISLWREGRVINQKSLHSWFHFYCIPDSDTTVFLFPILLYSCYRFHCIFWFRWHLQPLEPSAPRTDQPLARGGRLVCLSCHTIIFGTPLRNKHIRAKSPNTF